MTDYRKKKKLIDENKDMYISEYDKALSYDALSQIVDAKKNYAIAAKDDDKESMTKYNNIANAVRARYGNYTGGEFGDEYHPFVYADTDYSDYESKYEDELDRLYTSLKNTEFRYDYTEDPVYQAYKKVYDNQGELAYDRVLAENSLKTGGIANSHAYSAATQAMNYYNSLLASKIPELFEAAYKRHYTDKKGLIEDAYHLINSRENRDYSRHLDKLDNYRDVRDFNFNTSENNAEREFTSDENALKREFEEKLANQNNLFESEMTNKKILSDAQIAEKKLEYEREKDNRDYNYKVSQNNLDSLKFLYSMMRDNLDDEKWRNNHNMNASKSEVSPYWGNLGTGNVLEYARRVFDRPELTMEELYSLLGL